MPKSPESGMPNAREMAQVQALANKLQQEIAPVLDADRYNRSPSSAMRHLRRIQAELSKLLATEPIYERSEITRIEIDLFPDNYYRIALTKCFTPEYGGGETTIDVGGAFKNLHWALDAAKRAITVTRSDRSAFEAEEGKLP